MSLHMIMISAVPKIEDDQGIVYQQENLKYSVNNFNFTFNKIHHFIVPIDNLKEFNTFLNEKGLNDEKDAVAGYDFTSKYASVRYFVDDNFLALMMLQAVLVIH